MYYAGLRFYDSAFLDFLPDMAIISGRNGSILDCNELFAQEMEYTKKEILGKNIVELFENSLVLDKISLNLNIDERVINKRIRGINKSGGRMQLFISSNTIYDDNRRQVMTVSIIKNIQDVYDEEFNENQIKTNNRKISSSKLLRSSIYSIRIPKEIKIHLPKKDYIFNGDFEILRSLFVMIFLDSIKSMNKKGILAVGVEDKLDELVFEIDDSRNSKVGINLPYIASILDTMNGKIIIDTKPTRIRIHLKK